MPFLAGVMRVVAVRTYTVNAANRALLIHDGEHDRLIGKDRNDLRQLAIGHIMLAADMLAERAAQGIGMRLGERYDFDAGRVELSARAQRCDDRDILFDTAGHQVHLGRDIVDAVNNHVGTRVQQSGGGVFIVKVIERADLRLGIDGADTSRQEFSLPLANRVGQGMQLSINVCDADAVKIHQCQAADPAAGQPLDRIAPDPAQTEYRDMTAGQFIHGGRTQQAHAPLEPPISPGESRISRGVIFFCSGWFMHRYR